MKNRLIILLLFILVIPATRLAAQQKMESDRILHDSLAILQKKLDQMKSDQRKMLSRIDSVILSISEKEKADTEEENINKLLQEADQLSARQKEEEVHLSKKFQSGVRQQQGLNPNISLGGDFFGGISSSNHEFISDPGEISYGNNGFFMREVELALESPLDPFTRGKTFISITKEAVSIEEAYMEWLNLPLNMNLKIGIFYSEFGPINRYHDHALPQFDRPRALVNFFSNKGLGGTGLSSSFMLPRLIFADASTFDLTVTRGTRTGIDFSFASQKLLYIGQFKNFYEISENSYFEVRLSGATGKNPSEGDYYSGVGSIGLTYKWVPIGREKYRTLDWKTELLYSYRAENTGAIRSKGFYSAIQNKLNARFWIGARVGYSELPYDSKQHEWDYTINLDFWQSEFVFTRIQYQYNQRYREMGIALPWNSVPDDHCFLLQVCWAMGPHKHEAY